MAKNAGQEREDSFPKAMGNPARNALVAAGYSRLEEMDGVSEKYLVGLHGVGPKAIRELKSALAQLGLSLAP